MPDQLPVPSLPDTHTIQLHPDAEKLADSMIVDYGGQIIRLSKILAVQDSANQVQNGHIETARTLLRREVERSRSTEIALVVGGALFGAFVQGFVEAVAEGKTLRIIVYVIMGFLGISTVFWALQRR